MASMMTFPKIMQRPAAAASGGPAAGGIGVGVGSANTTCEQRKNAAAPGATLESTAAVNSYEKEEKKVDPPAQDHAPVGGIVLMKPAGMETGALTATPDGQQQRVASSNKISWNPLEEVDSALLSALCDNRERKALLRLEQVMVDFMRDGSCASMEVGGAYNSLVLNQQNNITNTGGFNGAGNGEIAAADGGSGQQQISTIAKMSQQGQQELQYQQQRGMKQTSFQRLILHRLADRFNILREQIILDQQTNNYSNSPGLIRLIKTEESFIPSHLLIDIDLNLLANYKNPRARNYGQGTNIMVGSNNNSNHSGYDYDRGGGTQTLMENMASTTLSETTAPLATPTTSSENKKKSKKKMVIMKRNTSSGSGAADGSGKGKQKGKSRNRKKLEDREKAYEEARARIFGISESSGGDSEQNTGGGNDSNKAEGRGEITAEPQSAPSDTQENAPSIPLNASSCHSSFSVDPDAGGSSSARSSVAGEHMLPSQLISSATAAADSSGPPSPEAKEPASPTRTESGNEASDSRQSSFSATSASFVPAAATGGAISKAVYRNRQQEENDPDFKRRSDVGRPAYVPIMAPSPYGAQNPYATAMGQQQQHQVPSVAVPSAQQQQQNLMMAAAIQHMQQQQQAAVAAAVQQQQQQQRFYHGGQPSNQFPTPQDAATAAAYPGANIATNNGNPAPPPQWVVPNRGYYPSPQQQQQQQQQQQLGQERQHPQAWQPRSSTSSQQQMPPPPNNSSGNASAQGVSAGPANTVNNTQPRIIKQPPTVLWGPQGARGGSDLPNNDKTSDAAPPVAVVQTSPAVPTDEDFPALR